MNIQSWDIFIIVGIFIMLLGFLIVVGFLIYAFNELKKITVALREFLKNTEERLTPLLEEAEQSLKSFRNVSNDIGIVTENARHFTGAIYEIAANLRVFSALIDDLREGVSLRALGVRAGIKAALGVLIKEIMKKEVIR